MYLRYGLLPRPLFEGEGGGGGGGGRPPAGEIGAYAARLQADLDTLRAQHNAALASHETALVAAKAAHTTELEAARTHYEGLINTHKTAHETALTEARTAGEAALTAANTAAKQRAVNSAVRAEAQALGMVDLDGLKLLDPAEIEKLTLDDAGAVVGAKPLLETVKQAKPWLFGQAGTSNPNPAPNPRQTTTKSAIEMTDEEYRAANASRAWRKAS